MCEACSFQCSTCLNYQKCKSAKEAEKIVYRALEIAIKHDIYSGGNIHTFIQEE